MKMRAAILALFVVAATITLAAASSDLTNGARSKLQLPKVLDFRRFKTLFNKSYRSLLDELVRQRLFLGRAFRAFVSVVNYLHFRCTHYLSVNAQSDQTPEERAKLAVAVDRMREVSDARGLIVGVQGDNEAMAKMRHEEELPVAELGDIERQLEELERRQEEEPVFREIVEELRRSDDQKRKKRAADETRRRRGRVSADELASSKSAKLDSETKRKIRHRVPSNNPSYEQVELSSQASSSHMEEGVAPPVDGGVAGKIARLTGASYVRSVVERAAAHNSRAEKAEQLPDEVFADLRQQNCFFEPRKQTGCGACYAFTAVALFEFLHCKSTGELVAFSEQYLIDCGHRADMSACEGGRLSKALKFVFAYGLELRSNYPYRAAADTCPYEPATEPARMGYLRPANPKFGPLSLQNFDSYLRHRPIMFGLRLTADFHDYGGGVDEGEGCESTGEGHAMLVVGHGREDGIEYYLFRNSHGPEWGERGYYKFSKRSMARCAVSEFGVVTLAKFEKSQKNLTNKIQQPH